MTHQQPTPRSESASVADNRPPVLMWRGPARSRSRRSLAVLMLPVGLLGVLALGGCGSTPAFCSHVSELEKSVQSLRGSIVQSGVSGFEASLRKVDASAKAVVSSAKSEFPTQTAALEKSVTALDSTTKELSSATTTQTRNAAIAKLLAEIGSAGTALSEFSSATKSKCS
jgi:hypothetical protein